MTEQNASRMEKKINVSVFQLPGTSGQKKSILTLKIYIKNTEMIINVNFI